MIDFGLVGGHRQMQDTLVSLVLGHRAQDSESAARICTHGHARQPCNLMAFKQDIDAILTEYLRRRSRT